MTRFDTPILLKEGQGPYDRVFSGRNRWGDYSATVVDPTNERIFWTFQEWAGANNDWATQITELRVVDEIEVTIDVRPGSATNPVSLGSWGVLPVALLGSASFAAVDVDAATLASGPGGAPASDTVALEDVNEDGFVDLLAHFRTQASGIAAADTEACLSDATLEGTRFAACDVVRVLRASCGLGFEVSFALLPLAWLRARRRARAVPDVRPWRSLSPRRSRARGVPASPRPSAS